MYKHRKRGIQMKQTERENRKQAMKWNQNADEEFKRLGLIEVVENFISSEVFKQFCSNAYSAIKAEVYANVWKESEEMADIAKKVADQVLRTEELFIEELAFRFKVRLGATLATMELIISTEMVKEQTVEYLTEKDSDVMKDLEELFQILHEGITSEYKKIMCSLKDKKDGIIVCETATFSKELFEFVKMLL